MTLEGPRVMNKLMPGVLIQSEGEAELNGQGWVDVAGVPVPMIVNRSYFDLSGYQLEDLTTFFSQVQLQEADLVFSNQDLYIQEWTIIGTEYISDGEIADWGRSPSAVPHLYRSSGCGFNFSNHAQEQIVYARKRTYVIPANQATSAPQLWSEQSWGTCTAATADKLHITRVVQHSAAGQVVIPDMNIVVGIIVAKETELPFLMRQKRSYEHKTIGV